MMDPNSIAYVTPEEANAVRDLYYEGQHGAEDSADTAARLALVQERDALRLMAAWAYGKLHSRTFNSMDDALELDRLKLWCEHGVVA